MSKKNTRNALDTSLSYAVIGLDLAKADCAVAAVPCSDDELGLIDRMDYESLFEQAEKLEPTLFAMEPAAATVRFPCACKIWGTRSRSFPDTQSRTGLQRTSQIRKPISTMQRLWRSLLFTIMIYSRFASRTLRSAGSPVSRRSESNCGHRLQNP